MSDALAPWTPIGTEINPAQASWYQPALTIPTPTGCTGVIITPIVSNVSFGPFWFGATVPPGNNGHYTSRSLWLAIAPYQSLWIYRTAIAITFCTGPGTDGMEW